MVVNSLKSMFHYFLAYLTSYLTEIVYNTLSTINVIAFNLVLMKYDMKSNKTENAKINEGG